MIAHSRLIQPEMTRHTRRSHQSY